MLFGDNFYETCHRKFHSLSKQPQGLGINTLTFMACHLVSIHYLYHILLSVAKISHWEKSNRNFML